MGYLLERWKTTKENKDKHIHNNKTHDVNKVKRKFRPRFG